MIAAVSLAVALSTRIVVAIVLNIILVIMGLLIGGNEVLAATWAWRGGRRVRAGGVTVVVIAPP